MTMKLKRGVSSFAIAKIPFAFKSYFEPAMLPTVPDIFGHVHASEPIGGWGMLGNDKYGDCTVAGIAHGQMVWHWATKKMIPWFTASTVVKQYFKLTGGADHGLDPVDVATYWQNYGLKDGSGILHKIRSFTALHTPDEVISAAYVFGFSGLAVYMPQNAEDQFRAGEPWDDTSGDPLPNMGHYVPLVGRNSKGNFMVVTWGRLHACTPAWIAKYLAGGIAYSSEAYMLASGLSPEGFNFDQLDADLAALGAN